MLYGGRGRGRLGKGGKEAGGREREGETVGAKSGGMGREGGDGG